MSDGRTQTGKEGPVIREYERERTLKEKAAHEAKRLLLMFLYLWAAIGSFTLYESLILAQHRISFAIHGVAIVKALVLAKVMLLADDLHLARRAEDRPLVYLILYQSVVFAVFFICFDILEKVVVDLLKGRGILQDLTIVGGGSIEGTAIVAVIITVALIPYFAFREIGRAIGIRELNTLLFRRRTSADLRPDIALTDRPRE